MDITDWYTPAGEPLVIVGTLVDGTGADPVPDAALVIREQRIVAVGPRANTGQCQMVADPQTTILPASSTPTSTTPTTRRMDRPGRRPA